MTSNINEIYFNKDLTVVKNSLSIEELAKINEFNHFSWKDYFFPLHTIFSVNEKIHQTYEKSYLSNRKFYNYKRYIFLNLLNDEFDSLRDSKIRKDLMKLEELYFNCNIFFLTTALGLFILFSRQRRFFTAGYFSIGIAFNAKNFSMAIINSDLNLIYDKMKNKEGFNQKEFINENDLLDFTMIKNWKCYLYWYEYI